jgi:peptidoglycan hydrolase-like protein with peptidoglycan-binding domain
MAWFRSDKRTRVVERPERLGPAGSPEGPGRADPRWRRRRWVLTLLILLVGAGGGWLIGSRSTGTTDGTSAAPVTFAEVVRTDVQARTDLTGGLTYVADRTIANRLAGPEGGATLTGVAAQGTVVRRGDILFSIDGSSVVLLLGSTPAWRTLEVGVVGADVKQLERNLEALGYGGFTVDDTFTSATRTAVQEWQRDIGASDDGVVDLGEVVFLRRAVRIDQHLGTSGDAVASGSEVLAVGPTAPVVTVDLEATQLSLVAVGDRVIVRLADGTETQGTVVSVGQEGAAAGGEQPGDTETVPATITLKRPADAAGLAGSSATVSVVTDTREDVLAVPVTALLAVSGGYVVEVDRGGRIETVAVTPGLYDGTEGLVEITATGLEAGDRVVVAVAGG